MHNMHNGELFLSPSLSNFKAKEMYSPWSYCKKKVIVSFLFLLVAVLVSLSEVQNCNSAPPRPLVICLLKFSGGLMFRYQLAVALSLLRCSPLCFPCLNNTQRGSTPHSPSATKENVCCNLKGRGHVNGQKRASPIWFGRGLGRELFLTSSMWARPVVEACWEQPGTKWVRSFDTVADRRGPGGMPSMLGDLSD